MTHICVVKQTIIGSDKGLSPGRRQAIIWTNDGILFIGPLRTNSNDISIQILTFSFTKIRLKVTSAKWRSFCLGLNVLSDSNLRKISKVMQEHCMCHPHKVLCAGQYVYNNEWILDRIYMASNSWLSNDFPNWIDDAMGNNFPLKSQFYQ